MATNKTDTYEMRISDWLAALRRRMPMMLGIFFSVLVVVCITAFVWPATYQASGTILIEQQELPSELVRSTISSFADQRIQVISQQVMTTENLFKIIQKYDLYADERKKKSREYVLQKMKDDVGFRMISADVIDPRSGTPTKATIAFSVSYKNRSADVAARVANELVSLYLQQNLNSRQQHTADATSFLSDEASRLNKDINEQQAKLEEFKQKHINDLPEQSQTNVQLLNRSDDELRDIDTRIRALDGQLVYLDAQLVQISPTSQVYTSTGERVLSPSDRLKFLRTELARVTGLYAPDHPDVLRMQREVAGLEATTHEAVSTNDLQRQLDDARNKLGEAREKYSADHPDVIKLQRSIASLETQIQSANSAPTVAEKPKDKPDNPAYIQIQAQREASNTEKISLQHKRDTVAALVTDYERRMSNGPAVDREYGTMLRDLESNQLKYREVRQKQMEAEVAQNLETERKGERFTLIEPPLTPTEPASPNRILIMVLGVLLAIGAAVGTSVLLEVSDTRVRNRRDLESLLHVPPLAVLPWIETDADRRLRSSRRRYAMLGTAVSVVLVATMVHLFFRPLDVLWQVVLRRLTG